MTKGVKPYPRLSARNRTSSFSYVSPASSFFWKLNKYRSADFDHITRPDANAAFTVKIERKFCRVFRTVTEVWWCRGIVGIVWAPLAPVTSGPFAFPVLFRASLLLTLPGLVVSSPVLFPCIWNISHPISQMFPEDWTSVWVKYSHSLSSSSSSSESVSTYFDFLLIMLCFLLFVPSQMDVSGKTTFDSFTPSTVQSCVIKVPESYLARICESTTWSSARSCSP